MSVGMVQKMPGRDFVMRETETEGFTDQGVQQNVTGRAIA
jgi:hypothetical protein